MQMTPPSWQKVKRKSEKKKVKEESEKADLKPNNQKTKMYIINCETDRQSRFDAWGMCSGLVHWDDPEGWDGEGRGRGVQDGGHM